jgi:hypothetical protein
LESALAEKIKDRARKYAADLSALEPQIKNPCVRLANDSKLSASGGECGCAGGCLFAASRRDSLGQGTAAARRPPIPLIGELLFKNDSAKK